MDDGTQQRGTCRLSKQTMRKLSILVLCAVAAGSLTLCAENALVKKGDSGAPAGNSPAEPVTTAGFTFDSTPLDRSNTRVLSSYAPMLSKVTPSVVTVVTSTVVRGMNGRGDPMEELLRRYYGLPGNDGGDDNSQQPATTPNQGERRVPNGMGSGVIVSTDGLILTNNHVVCDQSGEAADDINVTLPDGHEYPAKIVGRDPQTDVALIRIDAKNLPALPIADSGNLQVGDVVFAVGNPMGLSQTVTMGIVSAVGRSHLGILGERGYEDFIQTDASINPGNSGGALVDADGRLVGINTAIMSRTGGSVGIGFAIPSDLATGIAKNLLEGGRVERGYLGVTIRGMDPTLAESFGVEGSHGALVEGVVPESPAEKSGLKRGDVITSVDSRKVTNEGELRIYVSQKKPGTVIHVNFLRDGAAREVDITLASLDTTDLSGDGRLLLPGIAIQPVNDETARKFGLESREGVVISSVGTDSPFAQALLPGMQILEINGTPVTSVKQAFSLVRRGAVNRFWVAYHGQSGYIGLRVPKE